MEERITCFEEPGRDSTEGTLRLVAQRAEAWSVSRIVLASTLGDAARLAADRFAGANIRMVVVPLTSTDSASRSRSHPSLQEEP